MGELIAPLAAFATRFQQAVHSTDRAMKPAFIEQCGIDLRGGAVLKTLLMKARQHRGLLVFRECPRRMPLRGHSREREKTTSPTPVPGGTRNRQCLTGFLHTHQGTE